MYYYHVISDIPKHQGERFVLDESHPNGVYQRVYAQLDVVKEIYRNPQKFEGTKLSHAMDVELRELALEKSGKRNIPSIPPAWPPYMSQTHMRKPCGGPNILPALDVQPMESPKSGLSGAVLSETPTNALTGRYGKKKI